MQVLQDLSGWPLLLRLARQLTTLRRDQAMLVIRMRWINRTDEAMVVDPTAVWFWLQGEQAITLLQWEDLMGLLNAPNLPSTKEGAWLQQHTMVQAVYVPPQHFTERFLLFRVPTGGWNRCQLHIDPVWLGTTPYTVRLFCRKKP